MAYELLMSGIRVGPVDLRCRVVMGAHFSMFGEGNRRFGEPGFYGRRMGEYAADRARGGVGAVIIGQTAVHPTSAYQMPNNSQAWSEEAVPHFEDLTTMVHEQGAKAFIQLNHIGSASHGPSSKLPTWGPSPITAFFETTKPMDKREIREVVEYFATCALNAARGGFDGIEIQAAHGYLLAQFLSPYYNRRTDEYGGSLQNRMRFTREVLERVREVLTDYPVAVGARLVGVDFLPNGVTTEEGVEIAVSLEEDGLVDFLNVSTGVSGVGMVQTNYAPHLGAVATAGAVKAAVSNTPVFAVQRILTPDEAERILQQGQADVITLVRALIADPEWVNKAASGRAETIRLCTGSNQSCLGNMMQGWPVGCIQNPAVGKEAELGLSTFTPADRAKRVVVIGGGPAGLEAAWVAAARGHQVTLLERGSELGGRVRLAQLLPGREEMRNIADWRIAECERQGVEVRCGEEATKESVLALEPDAVIVATGGRPTVEGSSYFHPMPITGSDQPWVLDHEDALRRAVKEDPDELGHRVVILDAVGHIEAIGLGELLATQGHDVTVVTPMAAPVALDYETSAVALPRAVQAGARWRPNTLLGAIGDHAVSLVDTLSGVASEETGVDNVVIRTHGLPVDDLYWALEGSVEELQRVGDAVSVRYCDRAVFDGHQAGRSL